MKTTTMLFVIIFLILSSPALGDIEVFVRADLSKIKVEKYFSGEEVFKGGKAVWPEYGDFYFAFYDAKALRNLVELDSTIVILAPGREKVTPSFGKLYFVLKNILGGVGTSYGLDPEIYYVWPVDFLASGIGLEDKDGIIYHQGIAPFGDEAIREIKLNGKKITENSFAFLVNSK